MILLDTHIWLWWLLGDGALSTKERDALDSLAASCEIALSWVSIWETEMLYRKGRIKLLPDLSTWVTEATDDSFCTILPVDTELVIAQSLLPESFHGDPADRLIVTTAMIAEIPLATYDSRILQCPAERLQIWSA